jgi:hypothetical protein
MDPVHRTVAVSPPPWVGDLMGRRESPMRSIPPLRMERRDAPGYALVRITLDNAREMDADQLERQTAGAYAGLFEQFERARGNDRKYPVRFWNFVPGIHDEMGDGRDRYMVFNAGRYNAYETRYGGRDRFDQNVATASAVGCGGKDMTIICLACDTPGDPVDNPRQIKPYHYSPRFGPLPPCFARATLIHPPGGGTMLLTGGTAGIRGEESMHPDDLKRQLEETFENLSILVRVARERIGAEGDEQAELHRYDELRVYHPQLEHGGPLRMLIEQAMPGLRRLEMLNMDLCRSELLVEIEGVAKL